MAGFEIENQGRHDGVGFRELADDIWSNKPLLIILAVGLFLVVYLVARNRNGAIKAPGSTTPTNPAGSNGTYLVVNDVQPPNVSVTVNNPNPTTQQTPPPPPVTTPPTPPIGIKPIPSPIRPVPTPPKGTPRTVTVTHWPGQDSTIWGIAHHYHVNEQALYNLNKAKIGDNPNLIHAGLVLTLPS